MVLKVDSQISEDRKPFLKPADDGPTKIDFKIPTNDGTCKYITSPVKADPVMANSPEQAAQLLATAVKTRDVALVKQSIETFNNQLNRNNALPTINHIHLCKMSAPKAPDPYDLKPSAPPIVENQDQIRGEWMNDLMDNLRNNCLLVIDRNADYILRQKELMQCSYKDILDITTRDTLQVSSEMVVYSAVARWVVEECKRRSLESHLVNLKAVGRDLAYAPRYGLMTKKEFLCRTIDGVKGPDRSGFLEEKEIERIVDYVKKKKKNRPVEELPHKGSQPRLTCADKPQNPQQGKSGDSLCSTTSNNCDKLVINFLTCWTAIFD